MNVTFGRREGTNPHRTYQDTVFRMLFSDPENAIELFNALENTDYGPATDVKFTTLEDAVYAGLKNDLGFIIDRKFLVLSESQSTINNNMPLRQLEYISRTFEKLVSAAELYGRSNVKIPVPEFYVVYTGTKRWNASRLCLSDSFESSAPENSLELVVKIVKMEYNREENDETSDILERSEKLFGYSTLLKYIKIYQSQGYDLKDAVDTAVRRCIDEGILREFLECNSPEVKNMLFNQITSEEFAEIRAKEAAKESYDKGMKVGIDKGMKVGIASLIETYQYELGLSRGEALKKIMDKLSLPEGSAEEYMKEFWK